MILKSFKIKSNQKFVERLLKARTAAVSRKKIKSVGVILYLDEFADFEAFRVFFTSIDIRDNRVKIVAYSELDRDNEQLWDTFFNAKDFGWKGKLNRQELQEFVDSEFDLLISYYKSDILELNNMTAQSRANFKVGIADYDQRMYDLIIDVAPKDFNIFAVELKKYLNVLNKI
ncbi:hypothetical protein SAMN03097699_1326 [Flavobacteriaceae bacterium MAR_2010_188]|nr:hypothetical protein SAMN03097699_1326 [Flavobacteriaceae bacterium MAR_2010_188]